MSSPFDRAVLWQALEQAVASDDSMLLCDAAMFQGEVLWNIEAALAWLEAQNLVQHIVFLSPVYAASARYSALNQTLFRSFITHMALEKAPQLRLNALIHHSAPLDSGLFADSIAALQFLRQSPCVTGQIIDLR